MDHNDAPPHQCIKISGTEISKQVRSELKDEVDQLKQKYPGFEPCLVIVQVGNREDSNVYIGAKLRSAAEIGITARCVQLPRTVEQSEVLQCLRTLNADHMVHGIIVQLPLDAATSIDETAVLEAIAPSKDVDGLHPTNAGRLAQGMASPGHVPCTPAGCMRLLDSVNARLEGCRAVVIGRSRIVGAPMSQLLMRRNATVTVLHSRSRDVAQLVREADVLVVAVGRRHFVGGDWVKPGAIVIDCGINVVPDATRKSGRRLYGDVDTEAVMTRASAITPVPGGVGPMTVAMLMENTVRVAETAWLQMSSCRWRFVPLPLTVQQDSVPSDLAIARAQKPLPIVDLAASIGLLPDEIGLYGKYKAKVSLDVLQRLSSRPNGRYVVVGGINPTPLGEGKSTTSVGLAQALGAVKRHNAFVCLRQPSQGPTFGIKGGAAGGGYAQVIPMDEFNLHVTGDIHAVTAANNLLAAQLEARMFHEATQNDSALYGRLVPTHADGHRRFSACQLRRLRRLGIDKREPSELNDEEVGRFVRLDIDAATITWQRVLDTNDRFLRGVTIGQAASERGHSRACQFDIAVASEVMAVLALSSDLADLCERLARIVVAADVRGAPVTADDLGAAGAMAALMRDTIQPTLMQTLQGTPVFVHAGPFANIAHGNSSVVADRVALRLVGAEGYVVTEAGFGCDIGVEKFFNIKCRASGLVPDAVVIVCTVRALKMHGGGPEVAPGGRLDPMYGRQDLQLVRAGAANLRRHIENVARFGVRCVVAVNRFSSDTEAELALVVEMARDAGACHAVVCEHWARGGEGAAELADAVERVCSQPIVSNDFRFLYDLNATIVDKIATIARQIYGADGVELSARASEQIERYCRWGFGNLPVCIAKTHLSLSHDPKLRGVPTGFTFPIAEIRASVGAGFLYALAGAITTMPGLSTRPAIYDVEVDPVSGLIDGLF